jgi:hypothetical protein
MYNVQTKNVQAKFHLATDIYFLEEHSLSAYGTRIRDEIAYRSKDARLQRKIEVSIRNIFDYVETIPTLKNNYDIP